MECSLQDKIRNGIYNSLKGEVDQTNLFTFIQDKNLFVPKYPQLPDTLDKVLEINNSYKAKLLVPSEGGYKINITPSIVQTYEKLNDPETVKVIDLLKEYGVYQDGRFINKINHNTFFSSIHIPTISEFTYEKLVSFLLSINPNLKIELIDNLSEDGVSFIKEFIIGLRTDQRLKAMPEEVAHFFVELLPDDNQLKKDMLSNITSFEIYGQVYKQYKEKYVKENGKPDIDKIKREATAKLIAEYIVAISENNYEKVNNLVKVKEGWLRKWLRKFLEFFNLSIISHPDYKYYYEAAGEILNGEASEEFKKDAQARLENEAFTGSYFFKLTEEEYGKRYSDKVTKLKPLAEGLYQESKDKNLSDVIDSIRLFKRKFNDTFKKIMDDPKYSKLKEELTIGTEFLDLPALLSLNERLKATSSISLSEVASADNITNAFYQFLETVDKLSILSDSLIKIVNNREKVEDFYKAVDNINELQLYTKLYGHIKNILDNDFAQVLQESGEVGEQILFVINDATSKFDIVTQKILSKQREYFRPLFKDLLSFTRDSIGKDLQEKMQTFVNEKNQFGIEETSRKIAKFVETDEKINQFLLGLGTDVDFLQQIGFWTNAAIANGDIYVSSIASYIQDKVYENEMRSAEDIENLYIEIDKLKKQGLSGEAHRLGKLITRVSKKYDPYSKDGSPLDVVSFLSPVKYNEYYIAERKMLDDIIEKKKAYVEAKGTSQEAVKRLEWKKANAELKKFQSDYKFNEFTREYNNLFDKYADNDNFMTQYNEWELISIRIEQERRSLVGGTNIKETEANIATLRKIRSSLLTDFNYEGVERTAAEKEGGRLLKEYFTKSFQFREEDRDKSNLNFAIAKSSYMTKVMEVMNKNAVHSFTVAQFEERVKQELGINVFFIRDEYGNRKDAEKPVDQEDIKRATTKLREDWEGNNTRIIINKSFWDKRNEAKEKLKELQKGQEKTRSQEIWEKISDTLAGTKDERNQVNPEALEEDEIANIVALERELEENKLLRSNPVYSLYSKEDIIALAELWERADNKNLSISAKKKIFSQMKEIEKKYGKDNERIKEIKKYIKYLGSSKTFIPTDYYWEKMEELYIAISEYSLNISRDADVVDDLKSYAKNVKNIVYNLGEALSYRDYASLISLFEEQSDIGEVFKIMIEGNAAKGILPLVDYLESKDKNEYTDIVDWFEQVHITNVGRYSEELLGYTQYNFYPSMIYQQLVPTDPDDYVGAVSKRFVVSRVKDEYRTGYNPKTGKVELKVGYHIDNRGNFLPLPKEENPIDNKFIDEEYYKLKASNSLTFQYMELLKNQYLKDQERVDEKLRRYLDVPVMTLTALEEKERIGTTVKEKFNEVVSFVKQQESTDLTEQESGYRDIKDYNAVTGELLTQDIPRLGMGQRIKPEFVSRNLVNSISTYNYKSHDFAARSERLPVVEALINTLSVNQKGVGNKNRLGYFKKIYEKSILNSVPDNLVNSPILNKISRGFTSGSALRLMFSPVGGTINYFGASINNFIEAFSGKYVNMKEYSLGSIDAGKMTLAIVGDYAKSTDLSYWTLLYQKFDFVQGDFLDDMLDRSSLLDKATQFRQLAMIPMKAGELKSQSSMALAILHRRKAKDNNGKEYPFHHIYEKKNGKLVLKEGFDEKKYNLIDGTEFIAVKKIIHKINMELHGNYAKINSSELSRYSFGKLAENMKKWFAPAFQRRFGREGIDVVTQQEDGGGYYRAILRAAGQISLSLIKGDLSGVRDKFNYFFIKNDVIKKNMGRLAMDIMVTFSLYFIYAILLGYDDDDKNKKLKKNSWIKNIAILIFLRVYNEHTSYIPFPKFGLQELKRNLFSPYSLQSDTASNWIGVGTLALYHVAYALGADGLEKDLFYQKDTGYEFAEKGDAKIWKYVLASFGYKGYTKEPIPYIKDLDKFSGRLK